MHRPSYHFRTFLAAALVLGLLAAGGCGGKKQEVRNPSQDPYYGAQPPSVPPLKGEGFPFGKPPDLQVAIGSAQIGVGPAGWMWPQNGNEIQMSNVGWPPKFPEALNAKAGDTVQYRVPEVFFPPAAVELSVLPRSFYNSKSWPDKPARPETTHQYEVDKEVKVQKDGVHFEWKIQNVRPGDWVIVVHPRWDAPIGGDALYLVPVVVK